MQYIDIDMFLWGERAYVQGTHQLYAAFGVAAELELGAIRSFKSTFKKPLLGNCRFALGSEAVPIKTGWCTKVILTTGTGLHTLFVYPTGEAPGDRLPDDEEALVADAIVDPEDEVITKSNYDTDRVLTVLTSLNKVLLGQLLPKQRYGPWVLAGLNSQWPLPGGRVAVKLEQSIGGMMTRSAIVVDGQPVGDIQFIREVRQ